MQKLLLKLSPLFFLLLVFSCAKDNDLLPVEEKREMIQALEDDGTGKKCIIPCRQPDYFQVEQINPCSATLNWGFEVKTCGTFVVQLHNLSTGEWTYFNPAVSPFQLTGLTPCTQYTVGVSHVTELCASLPLQVSFETPCKPCKKECRIPCKPLDYHYAADVTETGATIHFGHEVATCGHFAAQLRNNATGTYTYYDPVFSPLVLTGLEPCTSYTIGVSHITDWQACLPSQITFTTECTGPCDAEGGAPEIAWLQQIGFDVPGVIDYWDNYLENWEHSAGDGHITINDPILILEPGADYVWSACYVIDAAYEPAEVDVSIWIDFDASGDFETDELAGHFYNGNVGSLCLTPIAALIVPDEKVCIVPARGILSINNGETTSPCGTFPQGQVVDFFVNIGNCEINP